MKVLDHQVTSDFCGGVGPVFLFLFDWVSRKWRRLGNYFHKLPSEISGLLPAVAISSEARPEISETRSDPYLSSVIQLIVLKRPPNELSGEYQTLLQQISDLWIGVLYSWYTQMSSPDLQTTHRWAVLLRSNFRSHEITAWKTKYQISPAQVSRRVPWIRSVESQLFYTRCRVQRTLVGFLPALCCHVSLCCCSVLVFYELNSRWRNKKPEWTLWRSSCLHRALNSTPLCLVSGSTVQLIHYLSLVT